MENVIEKILGFTMVTPLRLKNLLRLADTVITEHVPGDFVECGTCRGGSAALLAYKARQEGWKRNILLFDSFMGHPQPARTDIPDKELMDKWAGTLIASQADVKFALRTLDAYSDQHVKIFPGWFKDTLPKADIKEIALIHIDCDWYDSILYCLEVFYSKVVTGGYIIIDDYSYEPLPGPKVAVDNFFQDKRHTIAETFEVKPAKIFKIK